MFRKLNPNLIISYLGILVCIGMLAKEPSYHALVALGLFLANLNLRKLFKHIKGKEVENVDVKIHQLNKKLLEVDSELQKVLLALNFKGVVR